MVTKVFQLLLLLSPIVVGANINMDVFDLIFFRTGIIILFMSSLIDKPKRQMPDWVNRIVFGLFGLCIFNIFVHTFAPQVLANTMNIFLAIIGLYTIYVYLDEKSNLIKYILWAGVINLIFMISQRMGFDPIFDKIPQSLPSLAGAFLGNNPRIANYFALIIPFLPLALLPIGFVALFITKQFVILIPLVIILFARLKTVKLKIGFLVIAVLSAILLREHIIQSLKVRLVVWIPVLQAFFDRPLVGYGLGTKILPDTDAYFNSYLSFAIGVGILGLVWFGYVFKNIYKKLHNNKESIALITLVLSMLIEYPIEIIRLWYLIIGIIIMFLLRIRNNEQTV